MRGGVPYGAVTMLPRDFLSEYQSMSTASITTPAAHVSPVLTRQQAAEYIGIQYQTLSKWALTGIGPKITYVGRLAKYRVQDLDRYLDEQAGVRSPQRRRGVQSSTASTNAND